MNVLKKIWDHLEEYLLLPILSFSVVLVFIQVIMRYVFSNSLSWSEELARYLFVWLTWLGVSYAAKNRTHLRITVVKDRLPERWQRPLELVVILIWLGFGIYITIKSAEMMLSIAAFGQQSAALRLPMQYAYLSVPVGSGLMNIRLIEIIIKDYVLPLRQKGMDGMKGMKGMDGMKEEVSTDE